MRLAVIALFVSCLTLTQQAAAAVQHLPLIVLETGGLSGERPEFPLVTVGSLPRESTPNLSGLPQLFTSDEQPRWYTFADVNPDIIDSVDQGEIKFTGAVAGRTTLLLASPFLNIRQSWIPNGITLEDKTVTLEVTAWDGDPNGAMGKNFSRREAYLISLAALPAGDYVFHLHCAHLAQQPDHRYRPSQDDDASIPFTVAAPVDKNSATVTLPRSAIKSGRIAEKDALLEFAPPIHWARADSQPIESGPGFQVGTLNAYKFMGEFPATDRLPPPRVETNPAAEYPGENLVALIHAHIESGNFIQLRAIEFHGEDMVLTAEYWEDDSPRAAVVPQSPFLLIPLDFVPKGGHGITLNWRVYQTSQSQTPYLEAAAEGEFKSSSIHFTAK